MQTTSNTFSRRGFLASCGVMCIAGTGLLLTGCGEDTSKDQDDSSTTSTEPKLLQPGKVIVGSDCDYPPFTMLDGDQAAGFEYEIMTAACAAVDLECEYHTPLKFDTLVAAVAAGGTIDVAVSAITIDPARQQTVDFTDPYFDSNQSVTVLKDGGFKTTDDLKGANVAVQTGTTGESWAKENIVGATIIPFDEASAAFAALQAGKAEAVVVDLPVSVEMLKNGYDNCEIILEIPTGEQYGIAVAKENPALKDLLNKGLKAIRDNGEYETIYNKYFSVK